MSIALAGLAMGFLGSAHCIGMCGGIAGALSATRARSGPQRALASNAGRVASYSLMGAAVGAFGAAFAGLGGPGGMLALRAVAALLIVAAGLHMAGWSIGLGRIEAAGGSLWRRLAPLAGRARSGESIFSALAFGALWGWLPCGFVYSALAVAAASGSAASGALVMAGFGLGTLPATLMVGLFAGRGAAGLRSTSARRLAGAMVMGFGVWTFAAAASAYTATTPEAPSCHGGASAEALSSNRVQPE
ncbi:MAG: sulfite exporter TauE/SafE family protein [Candidatus Binatia bacterium]